MTIMRRIVTFDSAACAAIIVLSWCPALKARDSVPRIEIGAVLSSGKQPAFSDD